MNSPDTQTIASSTTDTQDSSTHSSHPLVSLLRSWAKAYVAQYEICSRIDPAARLRWVPIA